MSSNATPDQPSLTLVKADHYRENYSNSVQVRMSVWDFQLVFGTMNQTAPEAVQIENYQAIYLSPQQAKALFNVLGHNLQQYEQTFGPLALEPQHVQPGGPVN